MELLWEMAQLLVSLALILVSLLACVVIFAVDARKHNNAHVDASVIFEDPNSLKQVIETYPLGETEDFPQFI
uniref:Dolichyl-phosphate beta-glucosyltransferase n=1 Tax=Rhizophora mucronata TaxID=61149 RepID=A0A2P2LSE5_RHIMU